MSERDSSLNLWRKVAAVSVFSFFSLRRKAYSNCEFQTNGTFNLWILVLWTISHKQQQHMLLSEMPEEESPIRMAAICTSAKLLTGTHKITKLIVQAEINKMQKQEGIFLSLRERKIFIFPPFKEQIVFSSHVNMVFLSSASNLLCLEN